MRTKRYKYAVKAPEFVRDDMYSAVYREDKLYDLQNDPYENANLVSDPACASVRSALRQRLMDFMKKAGEPQAEILPAEETE